jgi:REP element-mobilizing transposase RayT
MMSHALFNVWIHAVFTTKNQQQIITLELEEVVYPFFYDEFQALDCKLKIVNGLSDHVHCLFLMNPKRSFSDVIKQIKGSSSHYINQHNLIFEKFAWQKGYAAFSVDDSSIDKVYKFIKNQKIKNESIEEEGYRL